MYFGTPPITFQNFHHFFKSNLYFRLKSVILRNLRKVMGGVQKYQSRMIAQLFIQTLKTSIEEGCKKRKQEEGEISLDELRELDLDQESLNQLKDFRHVI